MQNIELNLNSSIISINSDSSTAPTEITCLPEEIILKIFRNLDETSLLAVGAVNHNWKRIIDEIPLEDNTYIRSSLWYRFIIKKIIEIIKEVKIFQDSALKEINDQHQRLNQEVTHSINQLGTVYLRDCLVRINNPNQLENIFYIFNLIVKDKKKIHLGTKTPRETYLEFYKLKAKILKKIEENRPKIPQPPGKGPVLNRIINQFISINFLNLASKLNHKDFSQLIPAIQHKSQQGFPSKVFSSLNCINLTFFLTTLLNKQVMMNTDFTNLRNAIFLHNRFEEIEEDLFYMFNNQKIFLSLKEKEDALLELIDNVNLVNSIKLVKIDTFNKRKNVIQTFFPFINKYPLSTNQTITNFLLNSSDIELNQEEIFQYAKDLFGRNDHLACSILQDPAQINIIQNLSEIDRNELKLIMRNAACDTGFSLAFEKLAKISGLFDEVEILEILNINLNANYSDEVKHIFEEKLRECYADLRSLINQGHPINVEIFMLIVLCLIPHQNGNELGGLLQILNHNANKYLKPEQKLLLFKEVAKIYWPKTLNHIQDLSDAHLIELLEPFLQDKRKAMLIKERIEKNKINFKNPDLKKEILEQIKTILNSKKRKNRPKEKLNAAKRTRPN